MVRNQCSARDGATLTVIYGLDQSVATLNVGTNHIGIVVDDNFALEWGEKMRI
jgi:hypothetical protein